MAMKRRKRSASLRSAPRSAAARPGSALRWWHAAVFAAVFAATVVAASPARWTAAAVERATEGRVRIAGATGSAWQGRGDVVVRSAHGEITLRKASWTWLPARLAAGEVAFEVRLDGVLAPDRLVVAFGLGGTVLRGANPVPQLDRRPT
jgi:hypothetical protein